jgi:hypothetical protein
LCILSSRYSVQFIGGRGEGGGEPLFVPAGATADQGSTLDSGAGGDDDIPF